MFASQSGSYENKPKTHEIEIDLFSTILRDHLNSNFNEKSNSKIAKKIIIDSLSTSNLKAIVDQDFLQKHQFLNLHLFCIFVKAMKVIPKFRKYTTKKVLPHGHLF